MTLSPGTAPPVSATYARGQSSVTIMLLKCGRCSLMSRNSRSSAPNSVLVYSHSMLNACRRMRAALLRGPLARKYDSSRVRSTRDCPTYSTVPVGPSMRYTPG